MVDISHEFVARKLWLLVAVVTLPLTALAAVLGGVLPLPGAIDTLLVTGIPIVGWFLLTPLLLIFGEEVADAIIGPPGRADAGEDAPEMAGDPVESLERRYVDGELDDAEFERRLERLLASDETDTADGDLDSLLPGESEGTSTGDHSPGRARDGEDLLERE